MNFASICKIEINQFQRLIEETENEIMEKKVFTFRSYSADLNLRMIEEQIRFSEL